MTAETSNARGGVGVVAWMCVANDGTHAATENPNARDNYAKDGRTIRPLVCADASPPPAAVDRDEVRRVAQHIGTAADALARAERLTAALIAQQPAAGTVDKARFKRAPCYLCGYNGPGYYQPDTHPCASKYHAAQHQEPPHDRRG